MNGMITADETAAEKPEEFLTAIKAYRPQGVVKRVTRKEKTVLFACGVYNGGGIRPAMSG